MQKAKSIKNEKDEQYILVGSEIVVKATAELSRKIHEELVNDTKEVNIEELLDEKDRGND